MKKLRSLRHALRPVFVVLLTSCLLAAPPARAAESDDFNDGNDAGWLRYDPISAIGGTYAQYFLTNGGYRIRALASPSPVNYGPGRAGSIRTQTSYTNFYASVDVVDWNPALTQSIGMLGHVRQIGLGATDGYALTFNFDSDHSGNGDIDINRFLNEDPNQGANLTLSADPAFRLTHGRSYRFVWIHRNGFFYVRIYELPNLSQPILDVSTVSPDTVYPDGYMGFLVYDNSGGSGTADATFDNYLAQEHEPPVMTIRLDPMFNDVYLRWPGWATGFELQCADVLSTNPAAWTPILFGIEDFGTNFQYVPNAGFPQKYFRLVR